MGGAPMIDEVYHKNHLKKDGTWVDARSQEIYESFQEFLASQHSPSDEQPDGHSVVKHRDALWLQHVGGKQREIVLGAGRNQRFTGITSSTQRRSTSSRSSNDSSRIDELQRQLQASEQSQTKETQRLQEHLRKQDENIAELRRANEMVQQLLQASVIATLIQQLSQSTPRDLPAIGDPPTDPASDH